MKKDKLKEIETKLNLGLNLTSQEKSFYLLFSPELDLNFLKNNVK